MNFDSYRKAYFADPQPAQRFAGGVHGLTLYFEPYAAAVAYYEAVLGPPNYSEGDDTRGWSVGGTWLTLLSGGSGTPRNVEVLFVMESPAEAERLQSAFIVSGGKGRAPSDQLMYAPVRYCPAQDPFGTQILVIAPLTGSDADAS